LGKDSLTASLMDQADSYRRRYEQWVRSFAQPLYRYAYRLTGNAQIAEDLVQETFVEAWRSIARQKDEERARAWLFQILRFRHSHLLRDRGRRLQPMRLADSSDEHPADLVRQPLQTLAEKDAIQVALDQLTPAMRDTFMMVFVEGCTCRQTAENLRIPLGTVLSRLDGARRALRVALGEKEMEIEKNQANLKPPAGRLS
jgi:RNA polymerase sigma-70 factor (ECF subfamily)